VAGGFSNYHSMMNLFLTASKVARRVFETRASRAVFSLLVLAGVLVPSRAPGQVVFVSNDLSGAGSVLGVSAGGSISLYASGLGIPEGLAFDASGNLFVANALNDTILKVAPGGAVSTFASGLGGVNGVAVSSSGNVYATDNAGTVYQITPAGSMSVFASGFSEAIGLAFDGSGNLFLTDGGVGTLFKITPAGVVSPFATGLGFPDGLAIDPSGNLYVSDLIGATIYKVTQGGVVSPFVTGLGHAPRGLSFLTGSDLLVFGSGFSNTNGASLYTVSATGLVTFLAGNITDANFTAVMAVPEPGTAPLLLLGATQLGLLAAWAARKGRRSWSIMGPGSSCSDSPHPSHPI